MSDDPRIRFTAHDRKNLDTIVRLLTELHARLDQVQFAPKGAVRDASGATFAQGSGVLGDTDGPSEVQLAAAAELDARDGQVVCSECGCLAGSPGMVQVRSMDGTWTRDEVQCQDPCHERRLRAVPDAEDS